MVIQRLAPAPWAKSRNTVLRIRIGHSHPAIKTVLSTRYFWHIFIISNMIFMKFRQISKKVSFLSTFWLPWWLRTKHFLEEWSWGIRSWPSGNRSLDMIWNLDFFSNNLFRGILVKITNSESKFPSLEVFFRLNNFTAMTFPLRSKYQRQATKWSGSPSPSAPAFSWFNIFDSEGRRDGTRLWSKKHYIDQI